MNYKFDVIEKSEDIYKVKVQIINGEFLLLEDIFIAKYGRDYPGVKLQLEKIKKMIEDETIRRAVITGVKNCIKSY